jgi:hypothetical protein
MPWTAAVWVRSVFGGEGGGGCGGVFPVASLEERVRVGTYGMGYFEEGVKDCVREQSVVIV